MKMQLEGKVVVVTGGAGNIGSVCAQHLAAEGAAVVVADRRGSPVKAVVELITEAGGRAIGHEGDVSHERDVQEMIELTLKAFGEIHGLVNTVATARDSDRILDRMDVEGWDHIMAVNVRGPMLTSKHAIPAIVAAGGGSIVNFSSPNGFYGDVTRIAYATSKAAILGLTRSVATVYGKQGVRCNALAPNHVWSDAVKDRMGPDRVDLARRTLLTARGGRPEDIAHMVVFLVSDKAEFITGQLLYVDGGASAHLPWVGVK